MPNCFTEKHKGRVLVGRTRTNSVAWAFSVEIVLPFFRSKIKVLITVGDCRVISRDNARDINEQSRRARWMGRSREESRLSGGGREQVQKEEEVEKDEAQEAGGGTSEPRTASMCVIVSY